MLLLITLLVACGDKDPLACGPGTHEEDGLCLPDGDTGAAETSGGDDTDAGDDTGADDTGGGDDSDDTGAGDTGDTGGTGGTGGTGDTDDTDTGGATSGEDADGDGYASEASGGGDCDDDDSSVNPGAVEICGNGVDDDCDATPGDCAWSGAVRLSDVPYLTLAGDQNNDRAGETLAVGDFDGDGQLDLAVSAPLSDAPAREMGAVYVVYGPITEDLNLYDMDTIFTGPRSEDFLGAGLAAVPDLDGDGDDELLIGAPGKQPGYALPTNGGAWLVTDMDGGLAGAVAFTPASEDSALGAALAAGDLSGDGVAELIVAASYDEDYPSGTGIVYLFSGASPTSTSADDADIALYGDGPGDRTLTFGAAVATADLNGDGQDDLLVSAPNYYSSELGGDSAVMVFYGPLSGVTFASGADHILYAPYTDGADLGGYPNSLAVTGDNDGDGYPDFAAGSPDRTGDISYGYSAGMAYGVGGGQLSVFPTQETSLFFADWRADASEGAMLLGYAVSGAGDVDGDGNDDVLIGAPGNGVYSSTGGSALLYYGPVSGDLTDTDADVELYGNSDSWYFGASLAVGDLDGDGLSELIGGAAIKDGGAAYSGAVLLMPWGDY